MLGVTVSSDDSGRCHPPESDGALERALESHKRFGLDYLIAGFAGRDFVGGLLRSHSRTGASDVRLASAHIGAGMRYYNTADFNKAEAEFREAILAAPRSAIAYNDLGAVLNTRSRWDEAVAPLQKAIDLDPTLALARNNLAFSLSQYGDRK